MFCAAAAAGASVRLRPPRPPRPHSAPSSPTAAHPLPVGAYFTKLAAFVFVPLLIFTSIYSLAIFFSSIFVVAISVTIITVITQHMFSSRFEFLVTLRIECCLNRIDLASVCDMLSMCQIVFSHCIMHYITLVQYSQSWLT